MGMQFVINMKNTYRFLVVILLSFLIEIGQLIILLAFQPIDVFFDINDMFCNVAGGVFGFGLMMLINRLYCGSSTYKKETLLGDFGQVCHDCAHGLLS